MLQSIYRSWRGTKLYRRTILIYHNLVMDGKKFIKSVIFMKLVWSNFFRDGCFMRSSALAYTLLMSLVPLLASFSFLLNKFRDTQILAFTIIQESDKKVIISDLIRSLPYSTEMIRNYINSFLDKASTIGSIGIALFFITSLLVINTVENAFNHIFHVPDKKNSFKKFITYFLMVSYAAGFFYLAHRIKMLPVGGFIVNLNKTIIPVLFSSMAFMIMYKLIPNTRVKASAAMYGGIFAGILYEISKFFISFVFSGIIDYGRIYGALGVVPLFLLSLFILSAIIFMGLEFTFVINNYTSLYKKEMDKSVKLLDRY